MESEQQRHANVLALHTDVQRPDPDRPAGKFKKG